MAIPKRSPRLYSNQTPFQTNMCPTPLDELLIQFKSEDIARMNIITEVCTSNANLSEVCTTCNYFRRWINFRSRELEFLCLKDTQRNLHARFYGIVEPLLHKVHPTLLVHKWLLLVKKLNLNNLLFVILEKTFEINSVSGVAKTLVSEEVILNTLEDLKDENVVVRERLDKHEEMFKEQARTNNKIKRIFHVILSRLPPPS